MATYTHGTRTTVRHEWKVPGATYGGHGAAIEEVLKAISAARVTYTDLTGSEPLYDDWLRVYAADDEVILFFETDAPNLSAGEIILPRIIHAPIRGVDALAEAEAQPWGWRVINVHATCYACDISWAAGCQMYVTNVDDEFRQICHSCYSAENHPALYRTTEKDPFA